MPWDIVLVPRNKTKHINTYIFNPEVIHLDSFSQEKNNNNQSILSEDFPNIPTTSTQK